MPKFTITNGEDLSLHDVRAHQEDGGSVLRSAHIGNFDLTTLFLAQERFPIMLHEHVKGTMKGYEPGAVILEGEKLLIADNSELPVTHQALSRDLEKRAKVEAIVGKFSNPAQAHYLALQKLFPHNVQLASRLLLDQDPFISTALSELANGYPHLFHKYVTRSGEVLHLSKSSTPEEQVYVSPTGRKVSVERREIARLACKYMRDTIDMIHGSPVRPEGTVMNSNLYILLSTICEVYRGRSGEHRFQNSEVTALHFSGSAMMKYLILSEKLAISNQRTINAAYLFLQERLYGCLPERINFILIPTGALRNFIYLDSGSVSGPQNFSQYDVLKGKTRLRVANWTYSASQRELTKRQSVIRKTSSLPTMSRDISYCVSDDATDEEICDDVGKAFDDDCVLLCGVIVLARTPFEDLPEIARQRLGAKEDQHNVLVRIILKHSDKTLTKEQAGEVCKKLYTRIHRGSVKSYKI